MIGMFIQSTDAACFNQAHCVAQCNHRGYQTGKCVINGGGMLHQCVCYGFIGNQK